MKRYWRHKKIFYVPGMISLVLIPFACIGFLFLNKEFNPPQSMDIGYASEKQIAQIKSEYGHFPVPRNYSVFEFNQAIEKNASLLNRFHLTLKELQTQNDSIKGIHVHFGSHCDYTTYISVLDRLAIEKTKEYCLYKDDIWVWVRPIKKVKYDFLIANGFGCDVVPDHQAQAKEKSRLQLLLYKKHWPLFLGFLLIGVVNIFAFIKWHRHKTYRQKSYI